LGVSKQAVRQRIYRDTIPHRKAPDGTVFVRITAHNPEANGETNGENTANTGAVNRELVDELRDRVGFLERQLESEQRPHAELRRIIAGLVQRVPELEAPRNGHQTATAEPDRDEPRPATEGASEGADRRSWWRRWFGFE
jgi:hypothetical protein